MIAVDLGQSGARLRCDGQEFRFDRAKLAGENVIDSLRAIFSTLETLTTDVASLSLTGLNGRIHDPSPFGKLCEEFFGATRTAVIDDGLAGFIGALQGLDGITLSIGGGVVAVAGKGNTFSHIDGLGSTFGDEGGGFWLGKNGITRALATREGRDVQYDLLERFANEVEEFEMLKIKDNSDAALLAIRSAKTLLNAADEGIPAAVAIRNEGARLLAKTITAAWTGVKGSQDESPNVVITGGLARNIGYSEKILQLLLSDIPRATLVSACGDHLDGAEWIASHMKTDAPPLLMWA